MARRKSDSPQKAALIDDYEERRQFEIFKRIRKADVKKDSITLAPAGDADKP